MKPRKRRDIRGKGKPSIDLQAGRGGSSTRIPRNANRVRAGMVPAIGIRKRPRQQRSKDMVDAILQAAAELFAREGYARATTNKIAERAGVSVGSLYQYFPNKDSLLAELMAHHQAQVHEVLAASLEFLADPAVPLEDGIRNLFFELVALHQADPDLTKALSTAVLRESPALEGPHEGKREHEQAKDVIAVLSGRPDVRAGNYAAMAQVMGQATAHLSRWLVHEVPRGAQQGPLLEEVVRLLTRYLRKRS